MYKGVQRSITGNMCTREYRSMSYNICTREYKGFVRNITFTDQNFSLVFAYSQRSIYLLDGRSEYKNDSGVFSFYAKSL